MRPVPVFGGGSACAHKHLPVAFAYAYDCKRQLLSHSSVGLSKLVVHGRLAQIRPTISLAVNNLSNVSRPVRFMACQVQTYDLHSKLDEMP